MNTNVGRPARYTDDEILEAIEHGATTPNRLLKVLGLTHKTTLINRIRRMAEDGTVRLTERERYRGFTIRSNRQN